MVDLTPAEQLARRSRAPALDGLRGVACLIVLLHHCGRGHAMSWGAHLFNRMSASGWAGVDLFFVLSGFLITGLLLDARGRDGGLRRFWARRALRILPPAYAFLAVLFYSPLWRDEPWYPGLFREQAWFWLYSNNWLALFRPSLDHGVLGHFWSLAIEEQFYLLWPLAVLYLSTGRLQTVCLAIAGTSFVGHVIAASLHVDPDLLLSLTPARLDGLVLGAWVATRLRQRPPAPSSGARDRRLLGAAAILGAALIGPERGLPARSPWVLAVGSPTLGAIFALTLCALLLSPTTALLRRLCEASPVVSLGRVSYGFYILHVPVIAFLRRHWPPPDGSLVDCFSFYFAALLASAALAAVSWFAFERPILRFRP